MATSGSAKKQIIDSIKDVTNILVTVSKNPSVDELAAALGLTIFLNKLDKHATAVVSGDIPDAISFLEPDKTFEESADSLRDFIIALDKEKADHLRYKLVGDVVKIFITPYRTTISSDDLEFSQGDYNVEMVIGLNVVNSEDMDSALSSHGKILHDATVATITSGSATSSLGTIDWHSKDASGVSEMVSDMLESLKTAKVTLDEQISTALLTGIVASTDRFSNELTSSRVMTVAAGLMASGANQQLIVARLEEAEETTHTDEPTQNADGSIVLEADTSTKVAPSEPKPPKSKKEPRDDDGMMTINHGTNDLDEVARQVAEESQERAAREAEEQLDSIAEDAPEVPKTLGGAPATSALEDLRREVEGNDKQEPAPTPAPAANPPQTPTGSPLPSIGGTLNATTDQAEADKRRELEREQNQTILTHGKPIGDAAPAFTPSPLNASMAPSDEPPAVDIFSNTPELPPVVASAPATGEGDLLNAALSAAEPVDASAQPQVSAATDAGQSGVSVANGMPTLAEIEARSGSSHADMPPLPPLPPTLMPDFNNLPPLPPVPTDVRLDDIPPVTAAPPAPASSTGFNPSQFQIPGQ